MNKTPMVRGLRATQLVLAVIVLGLSSYVANWYNVDTLTASPSQVNFLIFSALWTLLSVAFIELAPKYSIRASHPYAFVAVEISNVLFYLGGFIGLAAFIGRLLFCRGSVCGAARADVVFAVFQFLLWAATALLTARDVFGSGSDSGSGASRAGTAVSNNNVKPKSKTAAMSEPA